MTEVCQRMISDEDDDSPEKCRERRRRRIEMRRFAAVSPTGSAPSTSQTRKDNRPEMLPRVPERKRIRTSPETSNMPMTTASPSSASTREERQPVAPVAVQVTEPVFGSMSVSGRSRDMEDAIFVRTSFCRPEIDRQQPVHFFAVYDGHGGPHVAALCKEKMHVFLEEELMRVTGTVESESGGGSGSGGDEREQEKQDVAEEWEDRWRRALVRTFQRMDEVAVSTCACGSVGPDCVSHSMEVALGGTTAVVAILTAKHIIVANCGDSRAVLCRGGRAIPLSHDHKPDRPDELERIEAAGGRVIFVNGARVEGILAMSRAIGDRYLKPVVTAEPEITFMQREPEDECLILASDGLWDVLSSELACEVAGECLREGNRGALAAIDLNAGHPIEDEGTGTLYPSRSVLAAALLTRLALGRKSSDNISVIVVDLKRS